MINKLKFIFTFYLFIAINVFTYAQEQYTASSFLETEKLKLKWNKVDGESPVFNWEIKLPDDKMYEISKRFHVTGNQPLHLTGSLGGESTSLIFCEKEQISNLKDRITCKLSRNDSLEVFQYFTTDGYEIELINELRNSSQSSFVKSEDFLKLSIGPGFGSNENSGSSSYSEQIIVSIDSEVFNIADNEEEIDFSKLDWIGFENRYFAFVIIPDSNLSFSNSTVRYFIDPDNKLPLIEFDLPITSLEPSESLNWKFNVFAGPKSVKTLPEVKSADLNSILFPNQWKGMQWLCLGLYHLLLFLFGIIKNWGLAIIFLALLVRILLSPVSKWAQKSQDKFVEAQTKMEPELKDIKENYKGGEQSERILRLYKKYNVSPFSGLKPLLVVMLQLPILIGLFHVLGSVFELREASFLWIETLAEPDHLFHFGLNIPLLGDYFNLLPFLMSGVSLVAFKFSNTSTSEKKNQNYFLIAMTIMFFILFYAFPAGMVLYWTFANIFQILHQKFLSKS